MKKSVCALVATAAFLTVATRAANASETEGFRVQFGLTFVTGLSDLLDKIEVNNPQVRGSERLPGGLALAVRHHFGNGFAVGASVGPIILARGDASFDIVPVGVDVRYRLSTEGGGGFYVRAGVEKVNASGDYVASASAGGMLAIGYDFAQSGRAGWGLEAGYHSSEVVVKATSGRREQKAKPTQGTLAVYYVF